MKCIGLYITKSIRSVIAEALKNVQVYAFGEIDVSLFRFSVLSQDDAIRWFGRPT